MKVVVAANLRYVSFNILLTYVSLRKKSPYSDLFWSVFFRIRTKYNTPKYSVSLRIQSECGKTRTRITPNADTFHAASIRWK